MNVLLLAIFDGLFILVERVELELIASDWSLAVLFNLLEMTREIVGNTKAFDLACSYEFLKSCPALSPDLSISWV